MKKVYVIVVVLGFCTLLSNKVFAKSDYNESFPTCGFGIGKSYGGIGVRFQWRYGGIVGGGFHFGGGYFPYAPLGFSIGAKFYAYKGLYINAQYGTIGVKSVSTYGYISSSQGTTIYGSSILVGNDMMFGEKKRFGLNCAIGIASPFVPEYTLPTFDLGFLVKL